MTIKIHRAARRAGWLLAAGLLVSGPAHAESTFDVTVLAATCFNCHGTDGRSPGATPAIAGRPEGALKAQLLAFQSDTPPAGTTIMNRLVKGYSEQELAALATYFSNISPEQTTTSKDK